MDYSQLTREQLIELAEAQAAELEALQRKPARAPHTLLPPPPAADASSLMDSPSALAGGAGAVPSTLAALAALFLAAVAEALLRAEGSGTGAILLYLAAILQLTATWAPFRPAAAVRASPRDGSVLLLAGVGSFVALTAALATFVLLREDLRAPLGRWLWGLSLLAVAVTALLAWRAETPHARWVPELPTTPSGRRWLAAGIALLLIGAALARLLWLEKIPWGINPDEGDRAAISMQIVRGTTDAGLFESGWYRISMMYFYLLALPFEWFGIGFVTARAFTALWGLLSVAGVIWIGLRQWGGRVALFAGAAMAFTGIHLQFSRETSEAGVTIALWIWSIACLMEGARTGRLTWWAAGGALGAWSLYFYPSGRVWLALAAALGLYWLAHAWWIRRRADHDDRAPAMLLRGLALAAVVALVVLTPFAAHALEFPREFGLRFQETSALDPTNALRLPYYDPEWSTARLLREQVARSLGIFSRFADGAGFWPMREPILNAGLALLSLLGLGAAALRWRDPRAGTLALWFVAGFVGMVVTVETPNLQRMATATPVLALAAGLTLDELVRRAGALHGVGAAPRPVQAWATNVAALFLALLLALELRFYFVDYAQMNLWAGWNDEGRALTLLPPKTLSTSLGDSFHMVNSGWVRLLAPEATRGGVRSPGAYLPLPEDGSRGLSFTVYPGQAHYLPWLGTLYPAAQPVPYTLPGESEYFTLLYVPATDLLASRGALATSGALTEVVAAPGQQLSMASPDAPAFWTATLRIPQQGNYAFRLDRGPARLLLSGQEILNLPQGAASIVAEVSLARGDHGLRLEGPAAGVRLEFAHVMPGGGEPQWRSLERRELTLSDGTPRGFAGFVQADGLPEQRRQDNALATGRLSEMLRTDNRPLTARWSAFLDLPHEGDYTFRLTLPAAGALLLNGAPLLESADAGGSQLEGAAFLAAGEQMLEVIVSATEPPRGALELTWQLPGGEWQILGPMRLRPGAPLVQPPLPAEVLPLMPVDQPMETIE